MNLQLQLDQIIMMIGSQLTKQEISYISEEIIPFICKGKLIPNNNIILQNMLQEYSKIPIAIILQDPQVQAVEDIFKVPFLDKLCPNNIKLNSLNEQLQKTMEYILIQNLPEVTSQTCAQQQTNQYNINIMLAIAKSIEQTIKYSNRVIKKKVTKQDLLILVLKQWYLKRQINIHDIISFIQPNVTQFGEKTLVRTLTQQNMLSSVLQIAQNQQQMFNIINYPIIQRLLYSLFIQFSQLNNFTPKNIAEQIIVILFDDSFNFIYLKAILFQHKVKVSQNQKCIAFLKKFKSKTIFRNAELFSLKGQVYNKFLYQNQYFVQNNSIRYQLIRQIQLQYLSKPQPGWFKFDLYLLIQKIMLLSSKQIQNMFNINQVSDIECFIDKIGCDTIRSLSELKIASQINKIFKVSFIDFEFTKHFKLDSIPNQLLELLFEDTEKKIQQVWASQPIFIAYNQDTQQILKHQGYENPINVLKQLNDDSTYSLIVQKNEWQNISNIKISHLTYINNIRNEKIIIQLLQPNCLRSLHIEVANIQNLHECFNLISLYSSHNTYKYSNICQFTSLKRIVSINDEYEQNQESMIQKLFELNSLQYVYVFNGNNIINNLNLGQNITQLQVFCCYSDNQTPIISLDITRQYPYSLQLLKNQRINEENEIFEEEIKIIGTQQEKKRLDAQLIH